MTLESDYLAIGLNNWKSTLIFIVSGALLMILEKQREIFIFKSGRTNNRIRSPR